MICQVFPWVHLHSISDITAKGFTSSRDCCVKQEVSVGNRKVRGSTNDITSLTMYHCLWNDACYVFSGEWVNHCILSLGLLNVSIHSNVIQKAFQCLHSCINSSHNECKWILDGCSWQKHAFLLPFMSARSVEFPCVRYIFPHWRLE